MICWIASWPRCGNTLCRLVLQDTLGVRTYSKYAEQDMMFAFGPAAALFGNEWRVEVYNAYDKSDKLWFIKTHEAPMDGNPAIYVARDGRDACVSLSHFANQPIQGAILGVNSPFPNWSCHYWSWQPHTRPHTLLVKFGDLLEKPDQVADQVGAMFGIEPRKKFENHFDRLHLTSPGMFRVGKRGSWQEEMNEEDLALFWNCHGEVMERLGYGVEDLK